MESVGNTAAARKCSHDPNASLFLFGGGAAYTKWACFAQRSQHGPTNCGARRAACTCLFMAPA